METFPSFPLLLHVEQTSNWMCERWEEFLRNAKLAIIDEIKQLRLVTKYLIILVVIGKQCKKIWNTIQ